MLKSFKDSALKRLWEDGKAKGIDPKSLPKIVRILRRLDAICHPQEMDQVGFHFHELAGDRKGVYAITIRANWRITFEWDGEHVVRVDQEDYHGRNRAG
jgi:proteic killer suppression protein